MPTGPEATASERAYDEAEVWLGLARSWSGSPRPVWRAAIAPEERLVIPEVDPTRDVEQRAAAWSTAVEPPDLVGLSRFAASLAVTEADAWGAGNRSLATRAYADRRSLFADRILPWAVPWSAALAGAGLPASGLAGRTRDELLRLGERHRPAPIIGGEGLHPPGCDGYGPRHDPVSTEARIRSLWGGWARLFPGEVAGVAADALAKEYVAASGVWEALRDDYPGAAADWHDLSVRARLTAAALSGEAPGG